MANAALYSFPKPGLELKEKRQALKAKQARTAAQTARLKAWQDNISAAVVIGMFYLGMKIAKVRRR